MDIDLWLWKTRHAALQAWESLGPEALYNLWVASGVVLFTALAWFSHRVMRKALGHTLFRGTWYNEAQYETLIKMIDEDSARGNRVMRADESEALHVWRFGKKSGIRHDPKSYF